MADLYNLLDELEEEHDEFHDNDDVVKETTGRPSLAPTEATEPMSEEWDSPRQIEVPVALQEAKRRQHVDSYENEGIPMTEELDATAASQMVENELYAKLHHHWLQERHCPELLEYDDEMVERIKAQIEERQEEIDEMEANGSDTVDVLMTSMAQLDLDRVKFVLSSWLTQRLDKIEAHPLHMREKVDHMSDAELEYLKQYGTILEHHLRQTVLDHIPEAWQQLDEPNMIDQPAYDAFHFWLVKETIDNGEVEHDKGTCLVAKYQDMRENMRENKVDLQL